MPTRQSIKTLALVAALAIMTGWLCSCGKSGDGDDAAAENARPAKTTPLPHTPAEKMNRPPVSPVKAPGNTASQIRALLIQASDSFKARKFDDAIKAVDAVIAQDKEIGDAYLVRGLAIMALASKCDGTRREELLRGAEADLAKAAKLCSPNDPQPLLGLARLAGNAGQTDEAHRHLDEAIRRDSSCAEALYKRAEILAAKKRYAEAAADIKKLLVVRPDFPQKAELLETQYECELMALLGVKMSVVKCLGYLRHPYYKIRIVALDILSRRDEPVCDVAIAEALKDADNRVVMTAIKIIGMRGTSDSAGEIAALASHKKTDIAINAARCAGALKSRDAVPALIKALADERASVREAAIGALEEITLRTMVYRHNDEPALRAAAIVKWEKWWKENGGSAQK